MNALAERFIEPSSSTENSPFEPIDERMRGRSFSETTLPAKSERLRWVGIDDGMDGLRCTRVYRSADMGKWAQDTTIYAGVDDEPALGRGEEFTVGSFQLSGLVSVTKLAEPKSLSGHLFDVTPASGYPAWDMRVVTELTEAIDAEWSAGFAKRTLKHYFDALAGLTRTWETGSTPGLMDLGVITILAGIGKHNVQEKGTKYEFCVTSWETDATQEVREFVLERIARLRGTSEDERASWATWPDERAFDDAVTFVNAWTSSTIRRPDVGIADDGEVNFLWTRPDLHVDLGFYGDGTFSYYAKDGDGDVYLGDDVVASAGLPKDLLALFKA